MNDPAANGSAPSDPRPLLEVRGLKVHYPIRGGLLRRVVDHVRAVDGVDFRIERGTTVGLVGESGSGKTTIGRSIVRLAPITAGQILYSGKDLAGVSKNDFFAYRKRIQMIFQDPFGSLNPRMTVYNIIAEPIDIHFPKTTKAEKTRRIHRLLRRVGLAPSMESRYPHEFSGGQRQRIGIARALAVEPEFVICDEPVSALDVSVQAQIINLLQDLREEMGLTYLFVAHDLAVVEHVSDYVLVMNEGKIVEQAPAKDIYRNPQNDYTKKLLASAPKL